MVVRAAVVLVALSGGLGLVACTPQVPAEHDGHDDREQSDQGVGHASSVSHLAPEVIQVLPHDRSAFTQGLEIDDGVLYESTGNYGSSQIRAGDPGTGATPRREPLPAELFGEGMTVTGDRIWQLTWKEGVAIARDKASLREIGRAHYSGQGWGACHDGSRLVTSDGSAQLTFRDPATFAARGDVTVRDGDGDEVEELNELECVSGQVWANVWGSDEILRIDPGAGRVTAAVDATGLLPAEESAGADVLNGIAAVPGTDEFLLTGKNWPHTYRVRFR